MVTNRVTEIFVKLNYKFEDLHGVGLFTAFDMMGIDISIKRLSGKTNHYYNLSDKNRENLVLALRNKR